MKEGGETRDSDIVFSRALDTKVICGITNHPYCQQHISSLAWSHSYLGNTSMLNYVVTHQPLCDYSVLLNVVTLHFLVNGEASLNCSLPMGEE